MNQHKIVFGVTRESLGEGSAVLIIIALTELSWSWISASREGGWYSGEWSRIRKSGF